MAVCERYALLPNDKKQMIAGELDRSVREIERKISVSFFYASIFVTDTNLITGYANSCGVLAVPMVETHYGKGKVARFMHVPAQYAIIASTVLHCHYYSLTIGYSSSFKVLVDAVVPRFYPMPWFSTLIP